MLYWRSRGYNNYLQKNTVILRKVCYNTNLTVIVKIQCSGFGTYAEVPSLGGKYMDKKDQKREIQAVISAVAGFLFWFVTLNFLECILRAVVFDSIFEKIGLVLGFNAVFAAVLTLLTSLFSRKVNVILATIFGIFLMFLFGSQIVYDFIFGSLYSVSQMKMGGAAVTAFWKETLMGMSDGIVYLLLLFVPLVVLGFVKKVRDAAFERSNVKCCILLLALAVGLQFVVVRCLKIGGTGYFSNYYFYQSNETTTDQAAQRFGLLTAMRLELFAAEEEEPESILEEITEATEMTQPESEPEPEQTEEPEAVVQEISYNVLELDFDALNQLTDNAKIQAINDYCASLTGTNKNEYTGMLSDYNLIVLCAESFDTGALDPELTPTLYRLANEGIVFNNYYNTFPNTTTDGEYTLCLGLYPDGTRGKDASSFTASIKNELVFALGNVFQAQKGIQSYGYHSFDKTYYDRYLTHPNMGYSMKFARDGMTFSSSWPASDLEMMEQSVDDYIGQEQFHAYYMTFSGHYRYDTSTNIIARTNWDQVKDLSYSKASRAYLSCNIELEKGMAYLMQRLEEEGVADKTAIVLAGDHFPYGLTDAQYSELVGYEIDKFNKFKSTLIFWVGGMDENIVVDEYCCNVDVLPTILNLWGFEYDSRLLAGTDVFSEGPHVAVLKDYSFYTDKVWLNASSGEIRYLVDESELPENYVEDMIKYIKKKASVSVDILNTNYYNHVFSNYTPVEE